MGLPNKCVSFTSLTLLYLMSKNISSLTQTSISGLTQASILLREGLSISGWIRPSTLLLSFQLRQWISPPVARFSTEIHCLYLWVTVTWQSSFTQVSPISSSVVLTLISKHSAGVLTSENVLEQKAAHKEPWSYKLQPRIFTCAGMCPCSDFSGWLKTLCRGCFNLAVVHIREMLLQTEEEIKVPYEQTDKKKSSQRLGCYDNFYPLCQELQWLFTQCVNLLCTLNSSLLLYLYSPQGKECLWTNDNSGARHYS